MKQSKQHFKKKFKKSVGKKRRRKSAKIVRKRRSPDKVKRERRIVSMWTREGRNRIGTTDGSVGGGKDKLTIHMSSIAPVRYKEQRNHYHDDPLCEAKCGESVSVSRSPIK